MNEFDDFPDFNDYADRIDNDAERLSWALVAAVARHDDEGYRLLEQAADETTIRAALRFTVGGAVGALLRSVVLENPGVDPASNLRRMLDAIANSASQQAVAAATND